MDRIEITQHGDFQVATKRTKNGFTAWGKMGCIKGDSPVTEPGNHVWFNFGRTRDEARTLLLEELGLSDHG